MLHSRRISSFLVTNAQFPDAMAALTPVCQLYVSIDASTKESLKKIDRPLFKDFWPRFIDSLKALSAKGQRTVYRLTIVKAWNDDEVRNYAKLLELGSPDFIEVKGVTFCGDSKASSLTMSNVPWHEEVIKFVEELVALSPGCVRAWLGRHKGLEGDGWGASLSGSTRLTCRGNFGCIVPVPGTGSAQSMSTPTRYSLRRTASW